MNEIVNVILLNMEYGIHEQITKNHDGSFTVFLNARDSSNVQQDSYAHAIRHIVSGDFEKYDVQEIETVSHK